MINLNQAPITNSAKAGIIPYFVDNGVIRMMFMVPSDPFYGGPDPQIAKGGIDNGETAATTAVREGEEELGLRVWNIVAFTQVSAPTAIEPERDYTLEVFAAKVEDPAAFDLPHYETGAVHWLTLDEFNAVGRPAHRKIVAKIHQELSRKIHHIS